MLPPILGTRKRVPFVLSCNVQNMDKEIDEENKWKNEIVKKIAIIQSDMQEIVKEIKKSK